MVVQEPRFTKLLSGTSGFDTDWGSHHLSCLRNVSTHAAGVPIKLKVIRHNTLSDDRWQQNYSSLHHGPDVLLNSMEQIPQLARNTSPFLEVKCSLHCSQELSSLFYNDTDESSPHCIHLRLAWIPSESLGSSVIIVTEPWTGRSGFDSRQV